MESGTTEKLTVYEWNGVTGHYNLADGHPRQMLVPAQIEAIGDVTELFINSESRNELQVKTDFERAYFELAGQPFVHKLDLPLSQYSGSSAIELMANYLRMHKKTVTMMPHLRFPGRHA